MKPANCKVCQHFKRTMDGMECHHPELPVNSTYDRLIISHDSMGKLPIPKECPMP